MTVREWAESLGACDEALEYLLGKGPTLATWLGSCGEWRAWAVGRLGVPFCRYDVLTCYRCEDLYCEIGRLALNGKLRYAGRARHFRRVVLRALRRAGVTH